MVGRGGVGGSAPRAGYGVLGFERPGPPAAPRQGVAPLLTQRQGGLHRRRVQPLRVLHRLGGGRRFVGYFQASRNLGSI